MLLLDSADLILYFARDKNSARNRGQHQLKAHFNHRPFASFFPLRLISILVIFVFVVSHHFSLPSYAATPREKSASVNRLPKDVRTIRIPEGIGKIQSWHRGAKDQTVILIQDAHALADAQRNIQKLIDYFQLHYGIRHVALEGASQVLDPQILNSFPDKVLLKSVLQGYFEKGELTGAAASAIVNQTPSIYKGVENEALYEEGVALYLKALEGEAAGLEKIGALKKELHQQKLAVYSPRLLEMDQVITDFYENHQDLEGLITRLAAMKAPKKETRVGKVYGAMMRSKNAPEVDQRPAAIEMRAKQSDIEGTQFYLELKTFIQEVMESLLTSDRERSLYQRSHELMLLEKLTRLELSYQDWADLKRYLTPLRSINPELFEKLAMPVEFYRNAEKRDGILQENLMAFMHEMNTRAALLVAGGFHTEGITQRLKKQGVSYIVLMPEAKSVPLHSSYRDHMNGQVSWAHYFQVTDGRVDLHTAFMRDIRDRLLAARRSTLTPWRNQLMRDLAQKGQIEKMHEYAFLIDEVRTQGETQVHPQWQADVRNFLRQLRELDARKEFTEQKILQLLRPSTLTQLASGPGGMLQPGKVPAHLIPAVSRRSEVRTLSLVVSPAIAPDRVDDPAHVTNMHEFNLRNPHNLDVFMDLLRRVSFNRRKIPRSLKLPDLEADLVFPLDWNGKRGRSNPVLIFGTKGASGLTFAIEFVVDPQKRPIFTPDAEGHLYRLETAQIHLIQNNGAPSRQGLIALIEFDRAEPDRSRAELRSLPEEARKLINQWAVEQQWDKSVVRNVEAWFASVAVNDRQRGAFLRLVAEGKADRIQAGFSSATGVLQPGTAGTRAEMENFDEDKLGPNYFSETTVIQYTWAFVNWYKGAHQEGAVFITKEVRDNSDSYGDLSAKILLGNGIRVVRVTRPVSTPFASFLAKWISRKSGIAPAFGYQISASHNKFSDNGIKFMGPAGQQLMPDFMSGITAGIPSLSEVGAVPEVNLKESLLYQELSPADYEDALGAYFDEIDSTLDPSFKEIIRSAFNNSGKKFVFTALHGASGDETVKYLERLGLQKGTHFYVVEQEMLPPNQLPAEILAVKKTQSSDPANDTVLHNAKALAEQLGIDMVIARDPDGDRFVIASNSHGVWKKLDGNQNAVVMLYDRLVHSSNLPKDKLLVMRSHATTSLIDWIAKEFGVKTIVVPVGFKYFGATIIRVFGSSVERLFFGAEESYGTSNGHINEKDGLSGLANMLLIVARLQEQGRTVFDYLDWVYAVFGYPGDTTINIPLPGKTKPEQDQSRENVKAALQHLKQGGQFGAFTIESFKDKVVVEGLGEFHDGYDLALRDTSGTKFNLLLRPSGTEPIFKAYFSWNEPIYSENPKALASIKLRTDEYVNTTVRVKVEEVFSAMARAEVRSADPADEVADQVVNFFRTGSPQLRSEVRQIAQAGIERLEASVESAMAHYEKQDLLQAERGLQSILKGITQPVVIGNAMTNDMSDDAMQRLIKTMTGAIRANQWIAVRLQFPSSLERRIRKLILLERTNQKDPLKVIPSGDDLVLYNEALSEVISLLDEKPALMIWPDYHTEELPQLDPYQYANHGGLISPEHRAEVFTAGLVWVSDALSQQTAEIISQDSRRSFLYHLSSPSALGPLAQISEWLVSSRATAAAA